MFIRRGIGIGATLVAMMLLAGCGSGAGGSSVGAPEVAILTTDLPGGETGVEYDATVEVAVAHAPATFYLAAGQLPAGVTLDTQTGRIHGFPHQVGTFRFDLGVQDGEDPRLARDGTVAADQRTFVVEVARGATNFIPQVVPTGQYRFSYAYHFAVAGGTPPYRFDFAGGDLPAGITVGRTGILGTFPTEASPDPYVFQVTATDSLGVSDTETFSFRVIVLPLLIGTSTLPEAAQNFPYTVPLTLASGGGGSPYTWSQVFPLDGDTDLATIGLEVRNGVLQTKFGFSGPTTAGTHRFRISVKDEANQVAIQAYELQVNPGPVLTSITPRRSSLPGPYIVDGLDFQPGARLVFSPGPNEVSVQPTFIDSTTLQFANAPALPTGGSVTVRVVNPDGGFFDRPDAFFYPFQNLAFGTKGFVSSALSSTGLAVGDLTGDGLVEILHCGAAGFQPYPGYATSTAGGLHLISNAGGLSFSNTTLDAANFYDVKIVDLNVDGKPDVAALGATQVKTWINNPLGTLTPGPTSALPGGFNYPSEMSFGLLNGDGIPDFAFGVSHYQNQHGQVHSMAGNGSGGFASLASAATGLTNTYGVISLACADFTGDGRADIVAGTGWNNNAGVLMRYSITPSSGGFGTWTPSVNAAITWGNTLGVVAIDLNGTGAANQFICMHSQDPGDGNQRQLAWFSGNPLVKQPDLPAPTTLGKSIGVVDGDFDGKGDFAISAHPGTIVVYKGATKSIVQTIDTSTGTPSVSSPRTGRVGFGDLDGDGRDDLVATTSYWVYDMQPHYFGSTFAHNLAGNGGSMGVVFYLNSSN